jgi:hypothetical protein
VSDQTSEIPRPADAGPSAEPTTPIPVRATALWPGQVFLLFVAVAAGAFLIGIAIAKASHIPNPDEVIAETDIGPAGATVRFAGGHVVFPEGAVAQEIHIVIRRSRIDDRLRVKGSGEPLVVEPGELSAYSFEPSNIAFSRPVEITFRLPEGTRNGSIFARRGREIVVLTGTIDPARATATTRVRNFRFGER